MVMPLTTQQLMVFVESGESETLYQSWKESGLSLSVFCARNAALIDGVWAASKLGIKQNDNTNALN